MIPLTLGEICSLVGLCISMASLVYVIKRFDGDKSKANADAVEERTERRIYQEQQSKRLDEIFNTVQKISSKMDDHTIAIERLNERQSTLFRRMEWVEQVLGKHAQENIGGTD